jgi:uncharacterized protein YcaQ
MPLFSRMGPYDPELLRRAAEKSPRRIVEYWAHVAAFMPVDLWPHMRHRMRGFRERGHEWGAIRHRPELVDSVIAAVRDRGASTARELDADLGALPRTKEHWGWNWSETKKVMEYLFAAGELAVAGRTPQFERLYDLPERVIPAEHLNAPEPSLEEASRELVRRAAIAHGVATDVCLRDYFRMSPELARPAVRALVEEGELLPVRIEGWNRVAYLHRDAAVPRKVAARALLSPFDPVVWERNRTEHLFGFRYRIEIYVPEPRRVHGYYVLPFLLGDRLVGRVDLKADRRNGALLVLASFAEPDAPSETAAELAAELAQLAGWLDLNDIVVHQRGDLAPELAVEVKAL